LYIVNSFFGVLINLNSLLLPRVLWGMLGIFWTTPKTCSFICCLV